MKYLTPFVLIAGFTVAAWAADHGPRIGMAKATRIAQKRVHGTIKSRELEKEHGKWIYSFDIRASKGRITEVAVDAYSGKILSVTHETPADEAKEKADDKKAKNH